MLEPSTDKANPCCSKSAQWLPWEGQWLEGTQKGLAMLCFSKPSTHDKEVEFSLWKFTEQCACLRTHVHFSKKFKKYSAYWRSSVFYSSSSASKAGGKKKVFLWSDDFHRKISPWFDQAAGVHGWAVFPCISACGEATRGWMAVGTAEHPFPPSFLHIPAQMVHSNSVTINHFPIRN